MQKEDKLVTGQAVQVDGWTVGRYKLSTSVGYEVSVTGLGYDKRQGRSDGRRSVGTDKTVTRQVTDGHGDGPVGSDRSVTTAGTDGVRYGWLRTRLRTKTVVRTTVYGRTMVTVDGRWYGTVSLRRLYGRTVDGRTVRMMDKDDGSMESYGLSVRTVRVGSGRVWVRTGSDDGLSTTVRMTDGTDRMYG